jgi:hypothetical protein
MQPANQPAGSVGETHLLNRSILVERKRITFDLAENPRGRFLRITERVAGRRNAIFIPLPGLEEFRDAINSQYTATASLSPLNGDVESKRASTPPVPTLRADWRHGRDGVIEMAPEPLNGHATSDGGRG